MRIMRMLLIWMFDKGKDVMAFNVFQLGHGKPLNTHMLYSAQKHVSTLCKKDGESEAYIFQTGGKSHK